MTLIFDVQLSTLSVSNFRTSNMFLWVCDKSSFLRTNYWKSLLYCISCKGMLWVTSVSQMSVAAVYSFSFNVGCRYSKYNGWIISNRWTIQVILLLFSGLLMVFFSSEVRDTCRKQFCLFWLPRAVDFKVSCSQIPRRDSNPRPSGWEVIRPNHSAKTLHVLMVCKGDFNWKCNGPFWP
jgi:hypothetical protein